jgi:TusE/DsrC/DsvC family sulfur relay protein
MPETMAEIMNPGAQSNDPNFPQAPAGWSPEDAVRIARDESLELGDDHWKVIRALQGFFAANEQPNMRRLHDALEERFHAQGGLKHLYAILPGGPVAQGCRLAGLEAPAGAVDKSFGSVQ